MRYSLVILAACGLLCGLSACGHVDLSPGGNPNRVLTGTVNVRMDLLPPPDTEVVVRIVEPADLTAAPAGTGSGLVIGERGEHVRPERVLGEEVIHAPAAMPVPFRIAYHASDDRLQRGLNVEARISWGGHVRFRTLEAQEVTPANAGQPLDLWVQPVQ